MELVESVRIKNNEHNPRLIKDDKFPKLVESIKTFPEMLFKRPLVCEKDGASYTVIGGNQRLRAVKKFFTIPQRDLENEISHLPNSLFILQFHREKKIPVEVCNDWTPEQKKEFIVKDNLSFGEWDLNVLSSHYDLEELEDWGFDSKIVDYSNGNEANNMSTDDVDILEVFDPVGTASGLMRIVFLFDTEIDGENFMVKNHPDLKIKKCSGSQGKIWQINLATTYGINE